MALVLVLLVLNAWRGWLHIQLGFKVGFDLLGGFVVGCHSYFVFVYLRCNQFD